jgi:hypothetical protein
MPIDKNATQVVLYDMFYVELNKEDLYGIEKLDYRTKKCRGS